MRLSDYCMEIKLRTGLDISIKLKLHRNKNGSRIENEVNQSKSEGSSKDRRKQLFRSRIHILEGIGPILLS